ncbi:MAG: DUF2059 domain-containing protein [Candidatus Acidiferrales bacterium]
MKNALIVLALCLISAAPCVAQQSQDNLPASAADIERYFAVMHLRQQMKDLTVAVSAQMREMMHEQIQKQPNLPPGTEARMDKMFDATLQKVPIDATLQAVVPVYQKYFTKGDVNALIAFYSSPTGKKVLAEMPQITRDAMQAESGVVRKYMADTMQDVQAQMAQMIKKQQTH